MAIVEHLVVDEYGSFVGKHQGRLRVTFKAGKDGETPKPLDAPLMHLQTVLIAGHGVSLSSDAIAACAEQGVPIHVIDGKGAPVAAMYASALIGTVQTRRAQLLAFADERGLEAARALALGKIRNQATLLKYAAKYRKERVPEVYDVLREAAIETLAHEQELLRLQGVCVDAVREQMMSVEGRAAKQYWAGVQHLVPEALAWPGRQGRGALDPFNALLNYGYGVLYGEVERACVLAGLDPYGGFLHVDRPGKPSLVLDMIEPFRPAVVDRMALALVGKGTAIVQEEGGWLAVETRRTIAEKVYERLDAPAPYGGKRLSLRAIVQRQARELALFLRREKETFEAYVADW